MRFKVIAETEMTPAQRAVYEEICASPRGKRGPPGTRGTDLLTRCPELARPAAKVGEYLRFNSTLPQRVMEVAILVTARHWTAQWEWYAHHAIALKVGVAAQALAQIARGEWPTQLQEDELAAYRFCAELHRDKRVGEGAFADAVRLLGENGAVDLIGACGYYSMIAMALNVNEAGMPEGIPAPLPPLAEPLPRG